MRAAAVLIAAGGVLIGLAIDSDSPSPSATSGIGPATVPHNDGMPKAATDASRDSDAPLSNTPPPREATGTSEKQPPRTASSWHTAKPMSRSTGDAQSSSVSASSLVDQHVEQRLAAELAEHDLHRILQYALWDL